MPTCCPRVGDWFSQLLIWPITILRVSSARAGAAVSISAAAAASRNVLCFIFYPPLISPVRRLVDAIQYQDGARRNAYRFAAFAAGRGLRAAAPRGAEAGRGRPPVFAS